MFVYEKICDLVIIYCFNAFAATEAAVSKLADRDKDFIYFDEYVIKDAQAQVAPAMPVGNGTKLVSAFVSTIGDICVANNNMDVLQNNVRMELMVVWAERDGKWVIVDMRNSRKSTTDKQDLIEAALNMKRYVSTNKREYLNRGYDI